MKALLFVPKVYSIAAMLQAGFEANGWEAKNVDYKDLLPHKYNRFFERTAGLPNKITKYWKPKYFDLINKKYLEYCEKEKSDIILIYNNQYFYPETIQKLKNQSKIVFFLGDNPLWSKTFDYNLTILKYADLVLSPDSHWQYELSSIGIPNIVTDFIGYDSKLFFPTKDIPEEMRNKYESDILFIGRNYGDSSGYKRTQFLSSFLDFNLKIFGTKEWNKWLPYFPDLNKHFNLISNRISDEELNIALNCAKIYPVDQNTGITNGIHLRVFETIGAGILPVVEWRKDIDTVFGDLLPVIKNYYNAAEIVETYLDDEELRKATIEKLRTLMENNYTPTLYIQRIINRIYA